MVVRHPFLGQLRRVATLDKGGAEFGRSDPDVLGPCAEVAVEVGPALDDLAAAIVVPPDDGGGLDAQVGIVDGFIFNAIRLLASTVESILSKSLTASPVEARHTKVCTLPNLSGQRALKPFCPDLHQLTLLLTLLGIITCPN